MGFDYSSMAVLTMLTTVWGHESPPTRGAQGVTVDPSDLRPEQAVCVSAHRNRFWKKPPREEDNEAKEKEIFKSSRRR